MKEICTIMTPTFNRGYKLKCLYNSLLEQTNKNFEWVIVDDGSTDNTKKIIKELIGNKNDFTIRYFRKSNEGKHTAINYALDKVKGKYFFIVDSDDYLPLNAIDIVFKWFNTIEDKNMYAGIGGIKSNLKTGKIIGETFEGDYIDCTSLERNKYKILGDKAEVFYTSILKKYKFPEYPNERFLSEAVVWNKIAADGYKIRWFNESIYKCEYREDGLTQSLFTNYAKSPKGFALYLKSLIDYRQITILKKYYYYGLFKEITKYGHSEIKNIFNIGSFSLYIGIIIQKVVFILKKYKK